MTNKLRHIYNQIFSSRADKLFINKKAHVNNVNLPKKNILLQMPEEYFYVISFNSIIKSLKKNNCLDINWIDISTNYSKRGYSTFLKRLSFYGRKWRKLFLFNGGKIKLNLEIPFQYYIFYFRQGYHIFKNLSSKKDVLSIKFQDILVGDLIYDTYLRYNTKPTINIKDKFLLRIIISSIYIYNKSQKYFESNDIDLFFTSYASYSHHGIVARLALKKQIKVISLGSHEKLFNIIKPEFPYHLVNFSHYKRDSCRLNDAFKEKFITESRRLLQNRLNGKIDPSLSYMNKSTFVKYDMDKTFFIKNKKPKVIIWSHDFFDSPHVRGWLLFEDYFEWLKFILVSADTESNDYFVKVHPNSSVSNLNVINNLLIKFAKIRLIPKSISTNQLVSEGIDLVITNHGTVAHELPLLGVPVLSSGNNPHISYSFSYTVQSKMEFKKIIKNPNLYPLLKSKLEIENEIYDYYFMHYLKENSKLSKENRLFQSYLRGIHTIQDFNLFVNKLNSQHYKTQLSQLYNTKNI